MILFKNDILRFPNAIIDYETPNTSFKRLTSLYREMKVENCFFPLVLLQPQLQGVNPYDPDLSQDLKVAIGLECKWNFWYYIREVIRIPPVASSNPISYEANRGNIALSWLFLNNIDVALIQPRQTGKSVSTDCIMIWLMYIGATNTTINMITKDNKLRVKNVERLKRIRDLLPKYLIPITNRDSDNQTDLTCKMLENSYITAVSQNSESGANNLARGLTSPITHIDEAPFIRFIGTTLPVALSVGTAARIEAEENGKPYGNIFTTTAGKRDDRDGKYVYDMIQGGAVWSELFLDAEDKASLKTLIKRNCSGRKLIVNATFSHRQLGKTDEWLYQAISNSGSSGEEADRDYFNIWTSGTQQSPLTAQLNETIRLSELDPVWNEISKDSYIIRWYLEEAELIDLHSRVPLIVGLDTSDAIGRDAIAIVIINSQDLSVVGAATVNETNLMRFSQFLCNLLSKYTNMILIPERKSSAQGMIDTLLIQLPKLQIDPFKRIYNSIVDNKDEKPNDYREIQTPLNKRSFNFYDRWKKYFGFNTTGQSRDLLYSTVLQNAAKQSGHLVRDRVLSNEIRSLIVKNGRIDHSNDTHDDMVIAWLLPHWFLTQTKYLNHYGLESRQTLIQLKLNSSNLKPGDEYTIQEQEDYRRRVDELYEELTKASDPYSANRIEKQLIATNNKLKYTDEQSFSIDSMIQNAAEAREANYRQYAINQRRQEPLLRRNPLSSAQDRILSSETPAPYKRLDQPDVKAKQNKALRYSNEYFN